MCARSLIGIAEDGVRGLGDGGVQAINFSRCTEAMRVGPSPGAHHPTVMSLLSDFMEGSFFPFAIFFFDLALVFFAMGTSLMEFWPGPGRICQPNRFGICDADANTGSSKVSSDAADTIGGKRLCGETAGFADFFAVIGGGNFHGAAHFIKA